MKIVKIPTDHVRGAIWGPLVAKIIDAAKTGEAVEVDRDDLSGRSFHFARMSMSNQIIARGYTLHGRTNAGKKDESGIFWAIKRTAAP